MLNCTPNNNAMNKVRKRYLKIPEQIIDRKGQKCETCKKGKYTETSQMDDLEGVLHCEKCQHKIERYN